jgi:hypothetical protein
MKYLLLGKSGLRVSELCLGTMTFGEDWGWGGGVEDSRKMFDAFYTHRMGATWPSPCKTFFVPLVLPGWKFS